jgi:RNase P subunit RPR2
MNASADPVPCPKCRKPMATTSTTQHRVVPGMQRTTFVCYGCNETRIYMLPSTAPEPAVK